MTLSVSTRSGSFVADGLATPRNIAFRLIDNSDLVVTANGVAQTLNVHYQLTGTYPSQQMIPLSPYWANGVVVRYKRKTPARQLYDMVPGVPMQAETLEKELDRNAMAVLDMSGEQSDLASRTLMVPEGEVAPPVPSLVGQDGKVLAMVLGALALVPNTSAAIASDVIRAEDAAAAAEAAATTVGRLAPVYAHQLSTAVYDPPATMNNPLGLSMVSDGKEIRYSSDPHIGNDWALTATGVTTVYRNFETGLDTNDGLTPATAWKTMEKVHSSAVDKTIVIDQSKRLGYLGWFSGNFNAGTRRIKFVGDAPKTWWNWSGKIWATSWRESYDLAFMGWVADGAAWSSTAAVTMATINSMLDAKYVDAYGLPTPIKWVASAAICKTTPGSFFTDNTTLWVNMRDGRKPDPEDGWLIGTSFSGWNYTTDTAVTFENYGFCYNGGAAASAACRVRPTTAFVENTMRVAMKNCTAVGSSGNGFEIYDPYCASKVTCSAGYCFYDAHSYTTFIATGLRAQFATFYEDRAWWANAGYGWRSNPTASNSNNGSTGHGGMSGYRVGSAGYGAQHSGIADVNGCYIMMGMPRPGKSVGPGLYQNSIWYQKILGEGKADAKCIIIGGSASADPPGGSKYHLSTWDDAEFAATIGEFHFWEWLGSPNVNVRANSILKNYMTGAVL